MAEIIQLTAAKRKLVGKKVKFLRREGLLPAVLYGKDIEPMPIELNLKETTKILRTVTSATLIEINIDGEEQLALVRDRQDDRLKNMLMHVDFLAVSRGQTLQTSVPLRLIGEAPVTRSFDAMVIQETDSLDIEALPKDLPSVIEVDISSLAELGDSISLSDLELGEGVTVLSDPDTVIAVTSAMRVEEEQVEDEFADELLDGAEPEVIERGKRDEEDEE